MYTVKINFENQRIKKKVIEQVLSGQTLLEVCLAHKVDLHFNCGGVCFCSTCHINVLKGEKFVEEKSRREIDILKKARNVQRNSRLACQCLLVENKGEIEITIPDQNEVNESWSV